MRDISNTPEFIAHYAAVMRTEAAARQARHPDFAGWLLASADRAEAEAKAASKPAQLELFG